jgi:hypothetical protein
VPAANLCAAEHPIVVHLIHRSIPGAHRRLPRTSSPAMACMYVPGESPLGHFFEIYLLRGQAYHLAHWPPSRLLKCD